MGGNCQQEFLPAPELPLKLGELQIIYVQHKVHHTGQEVLGQVSDVALQQGYGGTGTLLLKL